MVMLVIVGLLQLFIKLQDLCIINIQKSLH